MRERFVPLYYKRDLFVKLQKMYQGSRYVEEYFKEMEVTLIRAQIVESREATMARFLHGLNRDIQDIVEHGKKSYPTMSSNGKGKGRRKEKLLRRNKSPKKGSAPFKH
ncbi:hypothetical protein CR513_04535, partial [Mucuna pruriens]